jgi:hypothetical protein
MPIATFSRCQAGPIIVATGVDDFTEPIATERHSGIGHAVDFTAPVATEDHFNRMKSNLSPTSPTILHVDHLMNSQQYDLC